MVTLHVDEKWAFLLYCSVVQLPGITNCCRWPLSFRMIQRCPHWSLVVKVSHSRVPNLRQLQAVLKIKFNHSNFTFPIFFIQYVFIGAPTVSILSLSFGFPLCVSDFLLISFSLLSYGYKCSHCKHLLNIEFFIRRSVFK